ncbi:hypothetical protein [Paracoccus sp. (in: a-proteobacteria)]|uniref:hypothetical protein n=1 Tax=Paracoccus sp. TaxID=267 RepID=UPI0032201CC8
MQIVTCCSEAAGSNSLVASASLTNPIQKISTPLSVGRLLWRLSRLVLHALRFSLVADGDENA